MYFFLYFSKVESKFLSFIKQLSNNQRDDYLYKVIFFNSKINSEIDCTNFMAAKMFTIFLNRLFEKSTIIFKRENNLKQFLYVLKCIHFVITQPRFKVFLIFYSFPSFTSPQWYIFLKFSEKRKYKTTKSAVKI